MARIVFWEKPGCQGNARQKERLRVSGHELEVRDLLAEPWTEARLKQFFGDRRVAQWFNPAHHRVKSGKVIPATAVPFLSQIPADFAESFICQSHKKEARGRMPPGLCLAKNA